MVWWVMRIKVLESRLDRFVENNQHDRTLSFFMSRHSEKDIFNFFIISPRLEPDRDKTAIKKYHTVFDEAKGNADKTIILKDKVVFELLSYNMWDNVTSTCLPVWIGREKNNDIYLSNSFVSARHGYFILRNNNGRSSLYYLDNNSANGSLIDRKEIEPNKEVFMPSGSVLSVGYGNDILDLAVYSCRDMFEKYIKQ